MRDNWMVGIIGWMAIVGGVVYSGVNADPAEGRWTARLRSDRETVYLELSSGSGLLGSQYEFSAPVESLPGLSAGALNAPGTLHFEWIRLAGRFTFDGTGGRRPEGHYSFTPDTGFAQALDRLGYGDADGGEMFRLATEAVTLQDAETWSSLGFSSLSVGDLVRVKSHDVSLDLARAALALASRPRIDEVIRLQNHGVDPALLAELRQAGYADLPLDDVVRLRSHGIDAEAVREMKARGIEGLSADEMIRLRSHGVEPEYQAAMREAGLRGAEVEDLIRLRVQGVPPSLPAALRRLGSERFTTDDVVRLFQRGVDETFVARLEQAGLPRLDAEEILRLHAGGLDEILARGASATTH